MTEDDYTELPEEIIQQYIDGLDYHIKQGLISRKQLEHISNTSRRKLNELLTETNDVAPKEYLSKDQGIQAYSKILDTGITAQEALEYVASYYGKDQDWVNEVKNNNYLHAKEVVKQHKDHPVQKAMIEDGSMRTKALTISKTPNHQLRELHSQRKLHTTLNQLKGETNNLTDKVCELEVQTTITDIHMDKVLDLLGVESLTAKEKASKLKEKGVTQKRIAEYVGVDLRTIKRWWGDL